jgi:hypothetical protein
MQNVISATRCCTESYEMLCRNQTFPRISLPNCPALPQLPPLPPFFTCMIPISSYPRYEEAPFVRHHFTSFHHTTTTRIDITTTPPQRPTSLQLHIPPPPSCIQNTYAHTKDAIIYLLKRCRGFTHRHYHNHNNHNHHHG